MTGRHAPDEAQLRDEVARLERRVRDQDPIDLHELERIDALAAACAPLPSRLSARIAALQRHVAWQQREVPDGVLDDLVQSVQAQVSWESEDPARYWRRAGLSHSFLDAPRQLALWRRMAVAAVLVLGIGTGALLSGALRFGGSATDARSAADPRDELLLPDDPLILPGHRAGFASAVRGAGRTVAPGAVRMVGDGARGLPAGAANTTVVFPMRDLSSPNVSDMLDGLAIPDIGSAQLIEHN